MNNLKDKEISNNLITYKKYVNKEIKEIPNYLIIY